MFIYVVHNTIDGYAREDAVNSHVIGAYTNYSDARKVAVVTSNSKIETIEVDKIPPGIARSIREVYGEQNG